MYSIGQFLCVIQTNRWAFAVCASLGQGFLVRKRGKKSTSEASRARDFSSSSSQRGRRLKGKGKGVLGARETRGARAPRVSLAPKTPFPFPFKRLPRRLLSFRNQESTTWNPSWTVWDPYMERGDHFSLTK